MTDSSAPENSVLDAIDQIAADLTPDELGEAMVSLTHESLWSDASDAFGGWDVALAAALKRRLAGRGRPQRRVASAPVEAGERVPHPDATLPLLVTTRDGHIMWAPAAWFEGAPAPGQGSLSGWPADIGGPLLARDLGTGHAVAALSEDGRAFGWDLRIVPDAATGPPPRRLGEDHGATRWVALGDRADFGRHELLVTATRGGKIKVSRMSDVRGLVASDGVLVTTLEEGDTPIAYHLADRDDSLMLVSANGYLIHFPLRKVRPMGLKATGVRGIELREGAHVVGSILAREAEQISFITRDGFAKRVPVSEFRPQSRAGLGLVAMKLMGSDSLAVAVGCELNADILVTTDRGAVRRYTAGSFPLMARAARGERVIELAGGDAVLSASRLLPL